MPRIFSTLLCDEGGLLFVGGYNPDAVTAPPLYTPMDSSQGYYIFNIRGVGLGGQDLGLDDNDVSW